MYFVGMPFMFLQNHVDEYGFIDSFPEIPIFINSLLEVFYLLRFRIDPVIEIC